MTQRTERIKKARYGGDKKMSVAWEQKEGMWHRKKLAPQSVVNQPG